MRSIVIGTILLLCAVVPFGIHEYKQTKCKKNAIRIVLNDAFNKCASSPNMKQCVEKETSVHYIDIVSTDPCIVDMYYTSGNIKRIQCEEINEKL